MAGNFFDYLYGVNKKDENATESRQEESIVTDEAVVQDELIGSPWTHRFTIYCSNPSKTFLEELKAKDGVVAVYMKEKSEKPTMQDDNPPNNM